MRKSKRGKSYHMGQRSFDKCERATRVRDNLGGAEVEVKFVS